MERRLVDLVAAGRIRDERALKSAYRSLAKRIHPDLAARGAAGEANGDGRGPRSREEAFIALKADFEAARARLEEGGPVEAELPPLPYSRPALYIAFEELLARGFPRLPGRRWPAGPKEGYTAARARVLGILAGRDQVEPSLASLAAFLAFEEGYLALAVSDPAGLSAEVRLSHGLRNLLLNIAGYHGSGLSQPLRYAGNEWPRLRAELEAKGEPRPLAFLAILVADLEEGPACADEA